MDRLMYDTLVIGKGPAGATAAMYLARAGKKVLVAAKDNGALEKAGTVENYYACGPIRGIQIVESGIKQAMGFGAELTEDEIVAIEYDKHYKALGLKGEYESKTIILCSGAKRESLKISGIEKFEGAGISYCVVCDGNFFRNKRVGLVGAGDFMLSELEALLNYTKDITVFTNGSPITGALLKKQDEGIKIVADKITEVFGDFRLKGVRAGGSYELDGLFIAIGTAGAVDFARTLGVLLNGNDIITENGYTNMPGLFAAGDCTGGVKQIVKAASDGAIAALSAIKYLKETDK